MSSNIKDINEFVRQAVEKKKAEDEKKRLNTKNDILGKAVQKRKDIDAEIRMPAKPRFILAFNIAACVVFLAVCSFLAFQYMNYYMSQTKDMQPYYSKRPDLIGKLSMAMESTLKSGSASMIPENIEASERVRISGILEKLSSSEFELCNVSRVATIGSLDENLFEVGLLTRDEKIVFKVSYNDEDCKIIEAESIRHRVPIDL